MPINFSSIKAALLPGVTFASYSDKPLLLADIPEKYARLRSAFWGICPTRVGDLHNIPSHFLDSEGRVYHTKLVPAGREYPQGSGRLRGPDPPPEPDGKVATYRYEDNENMTLLKAEIEAFIRAQGWYG